MPFLDDRYLLPTPAARQIYAEVAALPIVDAHNHGNIREILENKNYTDIWQAEAATDHYVWEVMRKRGVPEEFVTGSQPSSSKWLKLGNIFSDVVGNPVYEWLHLDLQNMLGVQERLSAETAQHIWDVTRAILQRPENRPRALLDRMRVESMCTTDDPLDDLTGHEQVAEIMGEGRIRPTWRPDQAMKIAAPAWPEYVGKLEERAKPDVGQIKSLADLVAALQVTHDYFDRHGCLATDHGIEVPSGHEVEEGAAEEAFTKRLAGEKLLEAEVSTFMSYMLHCFGEMNAASGWVTQIHMGAVRDVRDSLSSTLGPDSGGDISRHTIPIVAPLRDFLNAFDGRLKVVLYVLDPAHLPTIATLSRAFGGNVAVGAAWWYNDTPHGMRRQLQYLSSVDVLWNFPGMVTDSRKLLSYGSRTEMFRRVLAGVLGDMVELGQVPEDLAARLARHVCYEGPKQFFGFP